MEVLQQLVEHILLLINQTLMELVDLLVILLGILSGMLLVLFKQQHNLILHLLVLWVIPQCLVTLEDQHIIQDFQLEVIIIQVIVEVKLIQYIQLVLILCQLILLQKICMVLVILITVLLLYLLVVSGACMLLNQELQVVFFLELLLLIHL